MTESFSHKWWKVRWMAVRAPAWKVGVRLVQNLMGTNRPPRSLFVHVGPFLIVRLVYGVPTFASSIAAAPRKYGTNRTYPVPR